MYKWKGIRGITHQDREGSVRDLNSTLLVRQISINKLVCSSFTKENILCHKISYSVLQKINIIADGLTLNQNRHHTHLFFEW